MSTYLCSIYPFGHFREMLERALDVVLEPSLCILSLVNNTLVNIAVDYIYLDFLDSN